MTYSEFEIEVKSKTRYEKYWYYALCTIITVLSIAILFFILTQPVKLKNNGFFYLLVVFFLIFWAKIGFYKLPNRNKVVTIDAPQTLIKKKAAIESLLSDMHVSESLNDNYCSFKYKKSLWTSTYDVYLFYDDTSVCFSVQGQDAYDGGFIDFGETERLRKKISNDLQTLLM